MRLRQLTLLILPLAVGCGGQFDYVPVSGKVTLNGKPLAEASVQFQPTGGTLSKPVGRGSIARTDEQGGFKLRVDKKQDGAVVATHRVEIRKTVGPIDMVPRRYNTDTKLTFEVPKGGTEAANFYLNMP